jgi:Bacterial Ig-like domain (group 1)/FlgD Ig-like domain
MSIRRFKPAAAVLAFFAAGFVALSTAGPGSGTATISPSSSVVAGVAGEWSLQYTAAEVIDNGTVRITIPNGWSAPQTSSSASPGYVTVATNQPAGTPGLSIAGQFVTINVDTLSVGNTITLVYGDDTASVGGRATAATTVGSYTFLVESDPNGGAPSPIASSPALSVVPAAPASFDILPNDTTGVIAGSFVQLHIRVLDEFGNRTPVASNRTVTLSATHGQYYDPSNHATPITSTVIASGTNTKRVDYRATAATPPGSPHNLIMFTSSGSPSLGGVETIHIVAGAMSTTNSLISATGPVVADNVSQSSVVVTSRDAFGNPRAGDTVLIDATGSALDTDPGLPTDAIGQAAGVVTNTVAQPVTVSATINAQAITATAPITFTAGPASGGTSIVDATTNIVANGAATSTITVTVRDANNNPVAGQQVNLAVNPVANATLSQPGGVTNALGQVTGTLSSTTTVARTVTATFGALPGTPITDNATVQFVAGPVANFVVAVDGSAIAGSVDPVTLTARDAQGNTVTNYTGTVNLTTTSGEANSVDWLVGDGQGSIANLPGSDDGTYTFALADAGLAVIRVVDTKVETIRVTASSGTPTGMSGNLVVTNNAADRIELVSGNGQSATVNTPVASPPTVRVLDQYNNPVPTATVTFTAVGGGGSVDGTSGGGLDSTVTTGSDGRIDCDVWRLGTIAGLNRLRAHIASGSITSVDFTATGTAGAGTTLVLTPGSKLVTQGTFEVVTATLTDAFTNPKGGERVDIVIKSGLNGTLAEDPVDPGTTTALNPQARWGNTDAAGRVTVRWVAPGGAGLADVLDASTASIGQGSVADVTYTTTAGGATNLRITFVGPSTRPADQTFQFLVEAIDGNNNVDATNNSSVTLDPEVGGGLTFSLTDFGPTVTEVDLVNGARTVYGRGTFAGDWDITTSGGGLGNDTEVVTITDTGVIDHYAVTTVPSVIAGVVFDVTVEAQDVHNNRVMGASNVVTLEAYDDVANSPAQESLLDPNATLAAGRVTVAETYTKAEAIRVRASASGDIGFSGVVNVTAAVAHRIAKISGDALNIVAGANQVLTAQVLDAYDNAVSNALVTFAVLDGGGTPVPPSANTDASGLASTTLTTGTIVDDNRVKATIGDENPPSLERVDYLVSTIPGPVASFQVTPASYSLVAGTGVALNVTGFDANSNLVSNDSDTPIQLTETGSAQFGAATGTLTAGQFNTTVVDTVAQSFTITATSQGGGATGTSGTLTVSHAGAYRVTKVSGDASGVAVGASQPLEVLVRDAYGNPVPNALVTFALTGALLDGSFTDAIGDPNDGITTTNGAGHALATLTTSTTVGTNTVNATILDGNPIARERVTFTVNTVAGGIAYYTVEMDGATATAGTTRNVTVTAYDASDNLVVDDVTQVDLSGSPGVGLVFGADPVTLEDGVAVTTVRADQVQTYQVRANTVGASGVFGLGESVTVNPAAPWGLITGTPVPATITANGVSTTTITSSVIQDEFGNQVPAGTPINVNATNGGVVLSGSPKLVAANGRIGFDLRSSTTPGTSVVSMASQTGTAAGTVNVTFAPPPAFVAGVPTPGIVVPGDNAAFSVNVQNTSTNDANLTTATTFTFTDGTRTFTANLAAPTGIVGGGNQTLVFSSTTVDAAFTPAFYQPTVILAGTDEFGAPINTPTLLPAQSLLVTSIQITAINAPPIVSRGQTPTVTVFVKNNGTQDTDVNDIDLNFTPGTGIFTPGTITPQTLAAGATGQFNISVFVDTSCPVNTYTIDAVATGVVGGLTVTDNSIAPFTAPTWEIVAAANMSYVAGTMTPMSVSRGDAYQFRATFENGGAGVVSLNQGLTYMRFTDGTRIYQASPTQPYAIAGNSQQQIVFALQSVAAEFTPGSYGVSFHLEGTESGAPFSQDPTSGADQVAVQTPADPKPGLVSPDQVSKGSSVSFTVQVDNIGGATVVLTPATTEFRFAGGAFTADLNSSGPTTLPPGNTTLTFLSTTVSQAIAAGSYAGSLVLNGFENGNPFSLTSPTDSVVVDDAPDIQIVTNTPSQSPITADQSRPFKVRMVVRNNGGAAVTFTDASIKFIQAGQDRSGQFNISTPTGFANGGSTLNGGGIEDTVIFDISDNTGNAMTAPAMMTIQGFLEVEDVNTQQAIFAERELGDFLQVQTPAAINVIAVVPSRTTVTKSMDRDFIVRALVQNTGTSDMTLNLAEPATDVGFSLPAGWVASPRNTLGNGGNVLAGGEIDTVLFNVTTSGSSTGTTLVNTNYTGTETNSGRVVTGGSSGSATITVETPVEIRITTTTHVAPNPGEANVDQPFDVRVLVQNTGQADARDVAIGMTSDGSSAIAPITPITEVGGGQTVAYDLAVVASSTLHTGETFTTSILSANDENSGEAVTPQASVDSTAVVAIQTPAVLDVTSLSPSQATVTRGQTAPWNVLVRLHNSGEADAVLAPPAANDLAFAIGGSNQIGYVVQPPAAFASGDPGWTLPGGELDSLIYVISVTGANEGLLDVTATVDGTDNNQPSLNVGDSGVTSVLVQAPAGFAIASTVSFNTVNTSADRDTVNTGFPYEIHVTVDNTGEAVDSVLVQLASNLGASTRSAIAPKSNRRQQIDVDGSHRFEFRITAPANPVALETFTATIASNVRSHNTGQVVLPQPPLDNRHDVVTQRRADLVMNLTSASGAVSTNQVFTMSATVTNAGQAGVSGPAEVTLTLPLPPNFIHLNPGGTEPLTRAFTIGAPVTWQIQAPATPQGAQNFTSTISTPPIDRNTGNPAFMSQDADLFGVAVVAGGAFTSPAITITTPAGAVDGTVSAGQHLFLDAAVTATTTTNSIVATLTIPAGYQIVGANTRSLGAGTGSPVSINPDFFEVIAPVNASVGDLFVTFTGVDQNAQQPVPTAADTVSVTTVPATALTTSASVTAPPEATDNSVTIGTTFTVTASVANAPSAAGIASPGTLTIALPSGYALAGGETAAKPFAIATAVTWQVNAPSQPSGPQQINVNITLPAPPDENSGQPAVIVDGSASIAMVTEGSAVAVRDVSQTLGIDVGPVPAGTADVQLLGLEIAYNVSDASVADARIDTIAVTVVGDDGTPLGPGTVAATLSRLAIDIGGAAPYEVVDPSTNPVVVSFLAGAVAERSIAPDAVRNAIVSISLDGDPSASEFSVGLRSGALAVRDSQSGQRLGVTDSQGNPLNGAITSEPLVILSSQFSEYVHNYPNPFRAGSQDTRIAYVMQGAGSVNVQVYDLTGDLVYEESIPAGDPRTQAGPQETTWDGRNGKGEVVRNGIYVCVLNAGGQTAKFRIAVAK